LRNKLRRYIARQPSSQRKQSAHLRSGAIYRACRPRHRALIRHCAINCAATGAAAIIAMQTIRTSPLRRDLSRMLTAAPCPHPALRNKLRRYRGSSHHHNANNPHISVAARFIARADGGTVPSSGIAQ